MDPESVEQQAQAESRGVQQHFDPAAATQHAYLGDLDDLHSHEACDLEPDKEYSLPLLIIDGVVLMPAALLPLWLQRRWELEVCEAALAADPPFRRLLIVVCQRWHHGISMLPAVGCAARINRMRRGPISSIQAVSQGCQRVQILKVSEHGHQATVRALPDAEPRRMLPGVASGAAYWPRWVWEKYDAYRLAALAQRMYCTTVSPEGTAGGGPLAISFWLAANLPLDGEARQRMLEYSSAAERLLAIVRIMSSLQLTCRACGQQLAGASDVLRMSEEGIAGNYVNPHGFVHDMITLRQVEGIMDEGEPEAAHSWFPGYAWQLSHCNRCLQHMGWRFSALRKGLQPAQFWGIRRSALAHSGSAADSGAEGS